MPLADSAQTIIKLVKKHEPCESQFLADQLGMTAVAIRQHLQVLLKKEWLKKVKKDQSGRGRPSYLWTLTDLGRRQFEDSHHILVVDLLKNIESSLGSTALNTVLQERENQQKNDYLAQTNKLTTIEEKLDWLAQRRNREGYDVEVEVQSDHWLFIENHCPIRDAANHCSGLCGGELNNFKAIFNKQAKVERIEHNLALDNRCVYLIQAY